MALCASTTATQAAEIRVEQAAHRVVNHFYVVDTELHCQFSEETLEALNSGVPITIEIDVVLKRRRDLIWDEGVTTLRQRFTLDHHALTDRYRLLDKTTQTSRSFASMQEAISALETPPPLPLIRQRRIDPERQYTASIRARLDITALPALMRPLAYFSGNWRPHQRLVPLALYTVMNIRRLAVSVGTLALFLMLLVSLIVLSGATRNSEQFEHLYVPLLLLNTTGLGILIVLIGINISSLIKQLRAGQAGSRLTLRMVTLFVALAVTPVLIVYGFSLYFVRTGIDSWFDVRVEEVLKDSLELSRAALDQRMRELLRDVEHLADELIDSAADQPIAPLDLDLLRGVGSTMVLNTLTTNTLNLDELRDRSGAEELTLLTRNGQIIRTSSIDTDIVPNPPNETVLLQLRQGRNYIGLDPIGDAGLYIRVVVKLISLEVGAKPQILQALFPVATRMNQLADNVQLAFAKYSELAYLREQLKLSFTMTLNLVLAFSVLSTVWAAIYSARRMAQPIRDLAEGTRAIARGEYDQQLPVPSQDDIGTLVESFNTMARRISIAQGQIKRSRDQADAERSYLEVVLGRLSSGGVEFRHRAAPAHREPGRRPDPRHRP